MYSNKNEIIISGVLFNPGEHIISEAEYNAHTPEGRALYVKSAAKGKFKNTENGNNTANTGADTVNI